MTAKEYLFKKLEEKNILLFIIKGSKYANALVEIMEDYSKLKQAQPKLSIEQRKENFAHTILPFKEQYGSEMCLQFFNYWSELNHSGKKMRFELQKTWEVGKRLATWHNNSKTFNNGKRSELDTLEQQLLAKFGC